ncbi:MFS transporter [Pseudonocardia hydrocarbonoxydans]|uniref:MFS transporter n=1 Tax=Pseudonocardia hydrocarbonoxydans TaxID=76726 RepID=A0A4Y3WP72_9PSEU|nr:MFS transporter [Pseudonocardia hydrocarbonoxydans]GEC19176.1 MFS transporter [Pseudonocardia hydrocarbonoxydans]
MTRPLTVLTAGVVTVGAQSFLLAPLLPDLAHSLAATPSEIGRVLAAYGVGVVVAALLLGPRLDRVTRRTALTAGAALLALSCAVAALAPGWEVLAGAQVVAGVGAGIVLPATYALAAELAPPGTAARATGRVLLGWSLALVAGVPVATVLADAVGWRGVLGALAVLAGAQVVLYRTLPSGPVAAPPARGAGALGHALRTPGVAPLLAGTLAFMSAFYAVFGFAGAEIRLLHGGGAAGAGLLALAYGVGFGLGAAAGRVAERARLAPVLAVLAAVYLLLGATVGLLPALLVVAVVWGLVNHVALTLLVSGLAAAPAARGAVLALNSGATYGGAAVAGLGAGPLYETAGLGWVAVAAAVVVAVAVPVVRRRTRTPAPRPVPVGS